MDTTTLIPAALTAADRCDASESEQALVLLESPLSGHRVQLCAHHYERGKEKLTGEAWVILVDDRPRILGGDFS